MVANVISSVEQTNFAGTLQQRRSNMLSVHFNFIYCAYLVFLAIDSIYKQRVLLATSALIVGPPGAIGLFVPKDGHATQPSAGQYGHAKCAWLRACGQQGWHSLHPGWAR